MIRFQEAQVINPFAYSFQLSFQIDPGFLTCKQVISVARFQIEADTFIIIVILRKIFFKRIIVPLDGWRDTIGGNKSSPAQNIEYFFRVFLRFIKYD